MAFELGISTLAYVYICLLNARLYQDPPSVKIAETQKHYFLSIAFCGGGDEDITIEAEWFSSSLIRLSW